MVHEKTLKLYQEAGFEYRPSTEDFVKEDFDRRTAQSRNSKNEEERPRYKIDQVYRIRQGTQDYIMYNQTTLASDMLGNVLTLAETIGKHDEPTFTKRYDEPTGRAVATALAGTRTVYDIPATPENIKKVLNKDTERTDTIFTLQDGNAKYGGFSRREFETYHFDDLLTKATTGQYPRELKPFGSSSGSKQQQEPEDSPNKRVVKEIRKGLVAETEEGSQEEREYEKMSKKFNDRTRTTDDDIATTSSLLDDDDNSDLKTIRKSDSADNEENEQVREQKDEEEDQQQEQQQKQSKPFGKKTTGQVSGSKRRQQ